MYKLTRINDNYIVYGIGHTPLEIGKSFVLHKSLFEWWQTTPVKSIDVTHPTKTVFWTRNSQYELEELDGE